MKKCEWMQGRGNNLEQEQTETTEMLPKTVRSSLRFINSF
jgi:hypothetical protein